MVSLAFVRTMLGRERFASFKTGWVELLCYCEVPLLFAVTVALQRAFVSGETAPGALAALFGTLLMTTAWAVIVWTFLSWPTIFAGHGVLVDHQLVTRGAYGVVRHPVYLGAVLVWLALGIAFESTATLLLTAVYVVPVYLLYIRSEERMMEDHFGERYRRYRADVPMLIPRRLRAA